MAKKSFTDAIGKTGLQDKSGVQALFSTQQAIAPAAEKLAEKKLETAQERAAKRKGRVTFSLYAQDVERLKDYIHLKKSSGEYWYSQSDALHQALELLLKDVKDLPARPEGIN